LAFQSVQVNVQEDINLEEGIEEAEGALHILAVENNLAFGLVEQEHILPTHYHRKN